VRGALAQRVNGTFAQSAFVLFFKENGMEHDVAVNVVGVLCPALEFLEIVPAGTGAGVGEGAQRGRSILFTGRADEFLDQNGILVLTVVRVDIDALIIHADLDQIGFERFACVFAEENGLRFLIGDAGFGQAVSALEGFEGGFGAFAEDTVYTVGGKVAERIEAALDAFDLIAVVAALQRLHIYRNAFFKETFLHPGGDDAGRGEIIEHLLLRKRSRNCRHRGVDGGHQ